MSTVPISLARANELRGLELIRAAGVYVIDSWLQEFGYRPRVADGLEQARAERGTWRLGRELTAHADRLAARRVESFNRTYERNAAARGQYERDPSCPI